jgi:hypothetical protein
MHAMREKRNSSTEQKTLQHSVPYQTCAPTAARSTAAAKPSVAWRNCDPLPAATTSKGEPPPEAGLESCPLPLWLESLVGLGAAATDDVAKVVVEALGSVASPEEMLEGEDEVAELDADVEVCVRMSVLVLGRVLVARVLVCTGVLDVPAVVEGAFLLLGHRAGMPMSFWKTPMMEVSPTSTLEQACLTAFPIFARPFRQLWLHVFAGLKSEGSHPWILVS